MEKFDFVALNKQVGDVLLPMEFLIHWNKEIDDYLNETFKIFKQIIDDPILAWGLAVNEVYNSLKENDLVLH
ncbi:MAG: hypothetical protein ACXACX_21115 [Candidatus Hodarchaeales archaeon]|jgi:hypothetical protein